MDSKIIFRQNITALREYNEYSNVLISLAIFKPSNHN